MRNKRLIDSRCSRCANPPLPMRALARSQTGNTGFYFRGIASTASRPSELNSRLSFRLILSMILQSLTKDYLAAVQGWFRVLHLSLKRAKRHRTLWLYTKWGAVAESINKSWLACGFIRSSSTKLLLVTIVNSTLLIEFSSKGRSAHWTNAGLVDRLAKPVSWEARLAA